MAEISQIELTSGEVCDIKDTYAREKVDYMYSRNIWSETPSSDTTLTAFGKTFKFHLRNGVVYVEGIGKLTPTTNGVNFVGTLPELFRPAFDINIPIVGSYDAYKALYIYSSGAVYALSYTSPNVETNYNILGSYPVI